MHLYFNHSSRLYFIRPVCVRLPPGFSNRNRIQSNSQSDSTYKRHISINCKNVRWNVSFSMFIAQCDWSRFRWQTSVSISVELAPSGQGPNVSLYRVMSLWMKTDGVLRGMFTPVNSHAECNALLFLFDVCNSDV